MKQKLSLPIALKEEMNLTTAVLAFAVPVLSYIAFDKIVLSSWRRKKKEEYLLNLRLTNAELLERRKKEALEANLLLAESLQKKIDAELPNGLLILSALYGKLQLKQEQATQLLSPQGLQDFATNLHGRYLAPSLDPSISLGFIDVTIPLQSLVNSHQLRIAEGYSKSQLVGFYDPCYGEEKQLQVIYQFSGIVHTVLVKDKEVINLPQRSHYSAKGTPPISSFKNLNLQINHRLKFELAPCLLH